MTATAPNGPPAEPIRGVTPPDTHADSPAPLHAPIGPDAHSDSEPVRDATGDLTPMMRQYREWKRRYPEYVLLFRLGDFYEAFYEDAAVCARALDITLTSRQKGEGAIPMAGVPHHAVETYIGRLVRQGHKVALCDQIETAPAKGKKLIRREVVRLITPGTVTDAGLLEGARNNFLAVLVRVGDRLGVALVDVSTADFWVGESADAGGLFETVLLRQPAEVLVPPGVRREDPMIRRLSEAGASITIGDEDLFAPGRAEALLKERYRVAALDGLGLATQDAAIRATGAALAYLERTQQVPLSHLSNLQRLTLDDHVILDETAMRNLELVDTLRDRGPRGSLLDALDRTLTPMGGRLLRQWLLRPLREPLEINRRLTAIETLVEAPAWLEALRTRLTGLGDLARLASRVSLGVATPRDLVLLRSALRPLPDLRTALADATDLLLREIAEALADLQAVTALLDSALVDDPPSSATQGGLIREGFDARLAAVREEEREARGWIAGLEGRERARTGIPTLRVRFNRVFGYGIEVARAHLTLVPPEYVRRQTLVGGERFVTPELTQQEAKVLGAAERRNRLEFALFDDVRRAVAREADRLLATARAVATVDVLTTLAHLARERGYVRPVVDRSLAIEISEGRHPVLELRHEATPFVANDVVLDGQEVSCLIVTGPNMAGKSTFMRQCALIVVLAQMGSFVPARSARLGVVDRVFTRIGAQDQLGRGQSTFFVEMTETATILRQATSRSLILLDEIGRGTSTFDGLAIAWAVAEHLHDQRPGAKVLFATHYHELTRLASELARVRNVHVAVREWRDEIVFLHKVAPGATDRSYGIQVARLAGLPEKVVARARVLLSELQQSAPTPTTPDEARSHQLSLFGPSQSTAAAMAVLADLAAADPDAMTPLDAMNLLHRLHKQLAGDR